MFLTHNRNLNKLSYGFAILFMTIIGVQQYLTPYFHSIGKPYIGFNILLIIYFSIFFSNFFASYFIDKYGTKNMIVSTALMYLVSISAIVSGNEYAAYVGSVFLGLSGAILWNSQNVYLLKLCTDNDRGQNSGFFLMLFNLGSLIGILLLGVLFDLFGYKNSFLIVITLGFLSLILFVKMDKVKESKVSKKIFHFSFTTTTLFRVSMIVSFIYCLIFAFSFSLLPLHIHMVTQSSTMVGILSSLLYLIPMIFSKSIGKYSDEHGRNTILYAGLVTGLIGLLLLHFVSDSIMSLSIGTFFLAFSIAFLSPIFIAFQGDISTPDTQAYVTNIFMLFKYIGIIMGITLGYIFGVEWAYLIASIILCISVILGYSLIQNIRKLQGLVTKEVEVI